MEAETLPDWGSVRCCNVGRAEEWLHACCLSVIAGAHKRRESYVLASTGWRDCSIACHYLEERHEKQAAGE